MEELPRLASTQQCIETVSVALELAPYDGATDDDAKQAYATVHEQPDLTGRTESAVGESTYDEIPDVTVSQQKQQLTPKPRQRQTRRNGRPEAPLNELPELLGVTDVKWRDE